MSKIEKALNQARQQGKMALVPTGSKAKSQHQEGADPQPTSAQAGGKAMVARAVSAASIARMQEHSLIDKEALTNKGIIVPDAGDNEIVQAFRELRTKILQQTKGQNAIILVTSVFGESGGSFVATNLGVAFAFDAGRTALLIDCNLRHPSLQQLLNDKDAPGITDYLENPDMEVADIIHPVGIERMRLIPAGSRREMPAEYFTSQRVRQFLDGIRSRYAERVVILDAPPMTESADTQILVELCDYVLLVAPYGRVTHMQIEDCIKKLDSQKLLGLVFNNQPRAPHLDGKEIVRRTRRRVSEMFASMRQHLKRLPGIFRKRRQR